MSVCGQIHQWSSNKEIAEHDHPGNHHSIHPNCPIVPVNVLQTMSLPIISETSMNALIKELITNQVIRELQ
jgi:hypothetical protein